MNIKAACADYYNFLRPLGGDEEAGHIEVDVLVDGDDGHVPHAGSMLRASFTACGFSSAGLRDGTQCVAKWLDSDNLLVLSGRQKAFPFGLSEPMRFAFISGGKVLDSGECADFREAIALSTL